VREGRGWGEGGGVGQRYFIRTLLGGKKKKIRRAIVDYYYYYYYYSLLPTRRDETRQEKGRNYVSERATIPCTPFWRSTERERERERERECGRDEGREGGAISHKPNQS